MARNQYVDSSSQSVDEGDQDTDNSGNITITFDKLDQVPSKEYAQAVARGNQLVPDSVNGNDVVFRVYEAASDGNSFDRVTSSGTTVSSIVARAWDSDAA